MSDDRDEFPWPPAMFGSGFQEAGEKAVEQQKELFERFLSANTGGAGGLSGWSELDAMSRRMATFKTRVQSGGRISIPDAEREALDIDEGDIVQTIVFPVKRDDSNE